MKTLNEYYESAKAQMSVLVKMAKSDNSVTGSENMFLRLMARKLNITPTDFDDIYENTDKYTFIPPETEEDRFILFYTLIQMMKVDLSVDVEEIEFCKEIGKKLSIPENKTEEIIKLSILKNKEVVQYDEIKTLLIK